MSLTKRLVETFTPERQLGEIWKLLKAFSGDNSADANLFDQLRPSQQRAELWDAIKGFGQFTIGASNTFGYSDNIDTGATQKTITYLSPLDAIPSVDASVVKPTTESDNVYVVGLESDVNGFTAYFNGPVAAGYKLNYKITVAEEPLPAQSLEVPTIQYVGPNGTSGGSGAADDPLSSLQLAASALGGSGEIIMLDGDYIIPANVMLDMSNVKTLKIRKNLGARVRVFLGEKVEAFTLSSGIRWTATVSAGYSMEDRSISGANDFLRWIFEFDTKEGIITEPNPYERGRTHRLEHSRLWYHATTGAVESGNSRFTYSGTTLSISATDGLNPNGRDYWIPSQTVGQCFVHSGTAETDIEIVGIEVYFGYNCFDFSNCFRFKTTDCVAFGAGAEGFAGTLFYIGECVWDEYAACANDGFGPGGDPNFVTWSKLIVRDVWAHDNGDEGFSSHYAVSLTIQGGLYENNCSSGITNALGTVFTCFSPYTRKNGYSFTGIGGDTGAGGICAAVQPGIQCTIHSPVSDGDITAYTHTASGNILTISSITQASTTVTVTTSTAHGLYVGQIVSIDSVTTSGYNLEGATVTSIPSGVQFTYTKTGGLTSPGTVGSGTARAVSYMEVIEPDIRNPVVRAFQLAVGCAIKVRYPKLEGVSSLQAGNSALFTLIDSRKAFSAVQVGTTYNGAAVRMTGWTDFSGNFDIGGVFASDRWTPSKVGLHRITVTLISSASTRTKLHLYKNGSFFRTMFDSATCPYKQGISFVFYNNLLTDYYDLYIEAIGGSMSTAAESTTDTTWTGESISEY